MLEDEPLEPEDGTIIKIVGVGGAGANALENMLRQGLSGVEYIVANTDANALARSTVSHKLQLGKTGLGAGANPESVSWLPNRHAIRYATASKEPTYYSSSSAWVVVPARALPR